VFTYSGLLERLDYVDGSWIQIPGAWTYTKVSQTSRLIITYQESLRTLREMPSARFETTLRVNGFASGTGQVGFVCTSSSGGTHWTTGVWSGIGQGNVDLTLWGLVTREAESGYRNLFPVGRCQVLVMEVEP
jgi:hypothetical protein